MLPVPLVPLLVLVVLVVVVVVAVKVASGSLVVKVREMLDWKTAQVAIPKVI